MNDTTIRHAQPIEQDEERTLWLFYLYLHGEDRLWWAYFQDALEIHTCLTELTRAFPCLELKCLQPCPHGLRISPFSYPASYECHSPQEAFESDQYLFPLAPFACDYLTSFVKGLGDATPCEQCQALSLTKDSAEAQTSL